jgi:D-arginine dehydrogenase
MTRLRKSVAAPQMRSDASKALMAEMGQIAGMVKKLDGLAYQIVTASDVCSIPPFFRAVRDWSACMTRQSADIVIVGGGIAGFSLAAALEGRARVILIEQENQPGYHSTGRSVAFWEETYGGPLVQPLTSVSGKLLAEPDPSLSDRPLLAPRGAIHIGRSADAARAAAMKADYGDVLLTPLSRQELEAVLPGLRRDWTVGLAEPSCTDIDVSGLFDGYRRIAKHHQVETLLSTRLVAAQRQGSGWQIETTSGTIDCAILVNAAGAWADPVARASGVTPLGVTPLRRTVVQLRCPDAPSDFPLIEDLAGNFYFKPGGPGRIWLTPHDESPDEPQDVVPDELDVAIAIDRFEQVVDWRIEAVERKWAGLRSFAPDRLPIYGFDPRVPGFFWFAGQGGFGMQTAPAAALIGAALLLGDALPAPVAAIDARVYAPDRLVEAGRS